MSDVYRQSALLLHGLNTDDRQWILAHLADAERAQLNGHLAELQEIGMPADRSLADSLLNGHVRKPAPVTQEGEPSDFGTLLRTAPVEAVLRVLSEQPSWLIAAILSIEPWPWRESIYVGVDASRRERIKQSLGERPPAMLARALVEEVEARLPAVAGNEPSGPAQQSAWSALGQQLKRLARG